MYLRKEDGKLCLHYWHLLQLNTKHILTQSCDYLEMEAFDVYILRKFVNYKNAPAFYGDNSLLYIVKWGHYRREKVFKTTLISILLKLVEEVPQRATKLETFMTSINYYHLFVGRSNARNRELQAECFFLYLEDADVISNTWIT